MDYEKKYNEALERARKLYEQGTITESLCYVFPELKESEDEKIRKRIISALVEWNEKCSFSGDSDDMIAWLEKQGEQKLTEFERAVKQVMEEAIECGDTRNLKADAEMLLSLVHNSSWSD